MSYTFLNDLDSAVFDRFSAAHPLGNMMQTSGWARLKKEWDSAYCGVKQDGQLIAAALVLFRPLPLGYTFAYVPRGPLMDYTDAALTQFFLGELKRFARSRKAVFLKFDPQLVISESRHEETVYRNAQLDEIMANIRNSGGIHYGFTKDLNATTQPRFMAAVKQDALERLPRDTEKKLRRAYRHEVKGVICGIERIDEFADIIAYTERRQRVTLRSREYFHDMMAAFKEDALLLLCEVDLKTLLEREAKEYQEMLAERENVPENAKKKLKQLELKITNAQRDLKAHAALRERYGDHAVIGGQLAVRSNQMLEMLYSGLNEDFAKFYPNYLSYVETFRYAFAHGCEYANMGGIPMDQRNGLTTFKFNFDPYIIEYIGEFDLVIRPLMNRALRFLMQRRKQAMVKKERMNTKAG